MASINDKLIRPGSPGTMTTLQAPGKDIGATSLKLTSSVNWPTDTAVIFSLCEYNSSTNERKDGTYTVWKGVLNGTDITQLQLLHGADQEYPPGDSARAMITISTEYMDSIIDAMLVSHNQDGTLKSGSMPIERLENVDINTAITTGLYGVYIANDECTSLPQASKSYIITNYPNGVDSLSDKQIAIDYISGAIVTWERQMNDGTWGSWKSDTAIVESTGITFSPGWSDLAAEHSVKAVRKNGVVYLSGIVKKNAAFANNETILTLNQGFRPHSACFAGSYGLFRTAHATSSDDKTGTVNVNKANSSSPGMIQTRVSGSSNNWINLTGISFIAEDW